MTIPWERSYLGRLRALAGDEELLFVAARAVARDPHGRMLLIRRADNGHWAFPAGALELGESIAQCAARELYEETGLRADGDLVPFAMYTNDHFTNEWGHNYQLFATAFLVPRWSGELVAVTDETVDAGFFDPGSLPEPLTRSVAPTVADLVQFERTGQFVAR